MSCDHPFDRLVISTGARQGQQQRYSRVVSGNVNTISCSECSDILASQVDPRYYLDFRAHLFETQTGEDPTAARDMFYHELKVGSLVVYPAMSGRSAQIVAGTVEVVNPNRVRDPFSQDHLDLLMAQSRHGEPYSLKVRPLKDGGSRWRQHYGKWDGSGWDDTPKVVTLWANAGSAVVIS